MVDKDVDVKLQVARSLYLQFRNFIWGRYDRHKGVYLVRFPVKSNNSHYSMPYVEYNKTESSIDAIYCCPVAFTLFRWNDSYIYVSYDHD